MTRITGRRLYDRLLGEMFGTILAVRTREKLAALTFDDGPDPASTPVLLDLLARHGAKATFFLVGVRAAAHPELVARIAAEGHAIGNHSWDHPALSLLSAADFAAQITRTRAVLAPHGQELMRPPYGLQSLRSFRQARRLGYRVVCWNGVGFDWLGDDAATVARRVLDPLRPGSIILLHDSLFTYAEERFRDRRPTLRAVEILLTTRPDYRFVTVTELLRHGSAVKRCWITQPDLEFLDRLKPAVPLS